ncbi:MAG: GNAT family N-acetyltransferase [Oscillospiraceae bacterium]|nr:GNAT family N-acetyltransferase [Oscillospiraceae bacterium]
MNIRFAAEGDSAALLRIYGQYIDTPITFEYTLPTEAEFARRIRDITAVYPYLVCEEDGRIVGYAYAHRQAERAAYQWNAELSVYLDKEHTGRGLGKRLYGMLMDLLRLQGIRTVYALVTVPNEKSEGLHRRLGFRHMGTQRGTGYKNGAWRDVAWFEKAIAPHSGDPAPLLCLGQMPAERIADILKGEAADL